MNKSTRKFIAEMTAVPAAPRVRTVEEQIEIAQYEVKSARDSIIERCTTAVERLEQFAADARKELNRALETADPSATSIGQTNIDTKRGWGEFVATQLPQQIGHHGTWGLSNALSEVETASAYAVRYASARAVLSALESVKADADRQQVALKLSTTTEVA